MTPSERHLWYDFLHDHAPRFQRQRPIGPYIVDFVCYDAGLVVELDGEVHGGEEARQHDALRSRYLAQNGFRVLRIRSRDVFEQFKAVCDGIELAMKESPSRLRVHFSLRDQERSETMYGLYTLLALLFFFGAWYILRLRHQVALLSHRISFHVGLSARLGILIVTYDAKSDEAVLSEDLARLLDLPEKIGGLAAQQEAILADEKHKYYPIVRALTSLKEDARYQLVRRGMAPRHFLLRGYVMKDLAGTPAYLVGTLRDITARENEEARLAVRAQFDGLTRVHNSSATRAWMKEHVGLRPGALFLLDIDKFKTVNDTIGHQGGDQALVCVANALRQALGGRGFVGRLGGDEFICYIEENDFDEVDALADAIHENVTRLGEEARLGLPITVSIGCALLEKEDYDAAYKKADGALYRAKNGGRNQHMIVG